MTLSVRELTVTLAGTAVLDNFSAHIPDRGLTYLSGASGVGKTTLLRVLAGLQRPDSGQLRLPRRPILLFQEDRLFPRCTALGQIEAVLPREKRDRAVEYLALAELAGAADKLPGELSGGMARRLALARCLAAGESQNADWYLLDEPFAGVDLERAERILKKLRGLDRPILLTGHTPQLARLCDREIGLA